MNAFEALREDIAAIGKAMDAYSSTAVRNLLDQSQQIDRLWADNAELRDEINAVANRVESLTRAVMADPAEVAAAIVNDANRSTLREVVMAYPVCECGHRYDHHRHHLPLGCYATDCKCPGYEPHRSAARLTGEGQS